MSPLPLLGGGRSRGLVYCRVILLKVKVGWLDLYLSTDICTDIDSVELSSTLAVVFRYPRSRRVVYATNGLRIWICGAMLSYAVAPRVKT